MLSRREAFFLLIILAAILGFNMRYCSHVEPRFFQSRYYTTGVAMLMLMAVSWSNCSSYHLSKPCNPYKCGDMYFRYPMWGGNQSSSCGYKKLELKCIDNQYPVIDINSQRFRVLGIEGNSNVTGTIRVARVDFWDSVCPERFMNTTLNNSIFTYRTHVREFAMFYGCPQVPFTHVGNNFTCVINGTASTAYYAGEELFRNFMPILTSCQTRVNVAVLSTALDQLKNGSMTLQETLKQGFDIWWIIQEPGKNGPGPHQMVLRIAAPVVGTGLVVCLIFFCFKRKILSITRKCFRRKLAKNDQDVEAIITGYGPLPLTRYSFSNVKELTRCFKDKVGEGGYGCVYKGKQLDGRLVAVKVLDTAKGNGEDFINEVLSISRTSHVNIVSLLGFCLERNKRALIYEFMPNGSLEKFIYDKSDTTTDQCCLGWEKLHQIAIGIARGLEYLHHGCNTRILHFDIKPHNILLDEDFCPKISDFGLAKLCTRKESFMSALATRGTIGYIAPELFSRNFGKVSHKCDVYSYGMVILKIAEGRNNAGIIGENSSDRYFPHCIYKQLLLQNDLVLHGVVSEQENETAKKMILVGLWCIQTDPLKRPSMSKVLDMLEGSIDNLPIPPEPFLSSPPARSPSECPTSSIL